jgi:hypothetical protein
LKPTSQETDLQSALRPWTARAAGMIERRLEDAQTHARGGNLPVANRRLAELLTAVATHISDARASFYRQAFRQHQPLDPDVHQLGLGPDHQGEAAARSAAILDRSYHAELLDVISDAQASLTSAALADQSGTAGGSFLQSWTDQNRDRLIGLTARQLSDAQIAIFEAVGQILVKPELR